MLKAGLLLYSNYGHSQEFVLQNMDMIFVKASENEKNKQIETFLAAQIKYALNINEISDENTNKINSKIKSDVSDYDYLKQEAKKLVFK